MRVCTAASRPPLGSTTTSSSRATVDFPIPDGPANNHARLGLLAGEVSLLHFDAEAAATFGTSDEGAYFNYTDYERNTMRMLRLGLAGAWRPTDRLAFVAEVRTEDFDHVTPYAAYVRVRPWRNRPFDIQAGRIPPTFGAMTRTAYGSGNILIGQPLAYQYLLSLRSDALPETNDDLLRMRGRGWLSNFPIGNAAAAPQVHQRLPQGQGALDLRVDGEVQACEPPGGGAHLAGAVLVRGEDLGHAVGQAREAGAPGRQ